MLNMFIYWPSPTKDYGCNLDVNIWKELLLVALAVSQILAVMKYVNSQCLILICVYVYKVFLNQYQFNQAIWVLKLVATYGQIVSSQ